MIGELRTYYRLIRKSLPWLDAWRGVGASAPFATAHGATLPSADLPVASPQQEDLPEELRPVILKALDFPPERAEALLRRHPRQNFIYATCDRKVIYDRPALLRLAAEYPNFYCCTANFLVGATMLEECYGRGLAGKLVYGSGLPLFSEDASLGPVILSSLPWSVKCDIAGNTLRRLLGMAETAVPEIPRPAFDCSLIDTHTHFTLTPCNDKVKQPAAYWRWPEWRGYFDANLTGTAIATPGELLSDRELMPRDEALAQTLRMCRDSGGRLAFYAVFNPNHLQQDRKIVESALAMPECKGIKIHPVEHSVRADDDRYDFVFAAAERSGKTVLTHSWEDSGYNPAQKLSLPTLFEKHLRNHPRAKFVFGHAGGRPSTMSDIIRICRSRPGIYTDLSGDYYHDGMIETLARGIGSERILFATDAYWFNAFAILGILLNSALSDAELELVTHANAEQLYEFMPRGH